MSKAWNDYAQKGIIEEIEVRGFDNLQRCIGLGMFKMTVEPVFSSPSPSPVSWMLKL